MRKNKFIVTFAAGAALLAVALPGRAQITYSGDDLLLNFRDTANVNPVSGLDLEYDLGNVSTFLSSVSPGSTVTAVSSSVVTGALGTPSVSNPIGFSASAGDDTSSTLWLSSVDTTPGTAPTIVSAQQSASTQSLTVTAIDNIGAGAGAGTSAGANAATVSASTSGNSYQAQGEENTTGAGQAVINFGSSQNVNPSKGGVIESIQNGSGSTVEALWEVPPTGSGSDTYLGYFTLTPAGAVDFTAAPAVVPEPSTNVLLAVTGIFGFILRRKIRALIA
jgi:hypothetical protein